MTILLKAKPVVDQSVEELRRKCQELKERGINPAMRVILVGNHKPSLIYTRNKKRFCEKIGADCEILHWPEDIDEQKFLKQVEETGKDPKVHGLFIQLPLPKHLEHLKVGELVPPAKDVDGFHSRNTGALYSGLTGDKILLPCTPKGIVTLLNHYNIKLAGTHIVVIGRSKIVGRPMAMLATNQNATVTLCHSHTKNLEKHTQRADIIISAVGKPRFLNKSYIGDNQPVIVDVGINHDANGKLCGDVDFDDVQEIVKAITPVPGGVGPMTILSLVQNLLQATFQAS